MRLTRRAESLLAKSLQLHTNLLGERLVLYLLVALLITGVLAAPTFAEKSGASPGITLSRQTAFSGQDAEDGSILLFRIGAVPDSDEPLLELTWELEESGWFPYWQLTLLGSDTLHGEEAGRRFRLAQVPPVSGVVYDVALSYHPAAGLVSIALYDTTANREVFHGDLHVVPYDGPVYDITFSDEVVAAKGYQPVAINWTLVIATEGGGLLPANSVDRSAVMGIRTITEAELPGELTLAVRQGNEFSVSLPLGQPTPGTQFYPLAYDKLPVGPVSFALQYRENGRLVWQSGEKEYVVGLLNATLAAGEYDLETKTLRLTLDIESDGPVEQIPLRLRMTSRALVWDPEEALFAEIPHSQSEVLIDALPADSTKLSRTVNISVPPGPELLRFEANLTAEGGLRMRWVPPDILLSTELERVVILPSAGNQSIKRSPFRSIQQRYEDTVENVQRVNAHRVGQEGNIVFIGSSSIRLWSTLTDDFPDLNVINAGFGGSQIIDSVHYADRLIDHFAPETVVLYAGSNDINNGKSPTTVLADFAAFVHRVHQTLPDTRIIFISIAPSPRRWEQRERVLLANQLVEMYTQTDERLGYVEVYPYMLGPDGTPQRDLYATDELHLSPKGYAVWTELIRPHL